MRMRVGVTTAALVLFTVGSALAQQCETFDECTAGMCQDGACLGVPLNGGTCDDGNGCTTNDTCVNGECEGTPSAAGPACNDFNECTMNDVCTDFFGSIVCMGTPRETGTPCVSDCGTCQPFIPGVPESGVICKPDPEHLNAPCTPTDDLGPCFPGRCSALGAPPAQIAFCMGALKTCPDDGNLCTGEFCNFETGECDSSPLPLNCFPFECRRCEPSTGACLPANVGSTCDDFNECTTSTICSAEGGCVAGSPQNTATPTRTTGGNTPTPTATTGQGSPTNTVAVNTATPTRTPGTPTSTPTQGRCVGDCDNSGQVAVNELVRGVNIALDRTELAECPQFDTNASSSVEVNELVLGVNSLLRGCVAPSAALGQ